MNKKLITSAVASAVALPTAAFAAIDDQGMAYVTAAEGLHGSLRMDILLDTDEDGRDASTETNSLRMWVNGTADLGGGLQSTYYWEFRGNRNGGGDAGNGTNVQSEAWDIGLKGAFGEIEFGKLAMSSYRLVPSASLAFERGSERKSPGADTRDGGWRYESPVINGFQFGVSGILNGSTKARGANRDATADTAGNAVDNDSISNPDGSLDEYALAMKYTMPIGLEVGAAYESVKNDGFQELSAANNVKREDSQGFRFGTRYGQDNWLLAYEYRTYEAYNPFYEITATVQRSNGGQPNNTVSFQNGEKDVDYNVHAFGVQVKLDRITMSANYSTEEVEFLIDNAVGPNDLAKTKYKKEREVIAIDAAYALGSRTHIVLGWKNEDTSNNDDIGVGTTAAAIAEQDDDVSTTYVFYRIDF